jgi:hypothetical protein
MTLGAYRKVMVRGKQLPFRKMSQGAIFRAITTNIN